MNNQITTMLNISKHLVEFQKNMMSHFPLEAKPRLQSRVDPNKIGALLRNLSEFFLFALLESE